MENKKKSPFEEANKILDGKIKDFLKVAVTRDGSKHTIKNIERNAQGTIVSISGTVIIDKKEVDITWNVTGGNISIQNNGVDLVTKETAKDFLK